MVDVPRGGGRYETFSACSQCFGFGLCQNRNKETKNTGYETLKASDRQ